MEFHRLQWNSTDFQRSSTNFTGVLQTGFHTLCRCCSTCCAWSRSPSWAGRCRHVTGAAAVHLAQWCMLDGLGGPRQLPIATAMFITLPLHAGWAA